MTCAELWHCLVNHDAPRSDTDGKSNKFFNCISRKVLCQKCNSNHKNRD